MRRDRILLPTPTGLNRDIKSQYFSNVEAFRTRVGNVDVDVGNALKNSCAPHDADLVAGFENASNFQLWVNGAKVHISDDVILQTATHAPGDDQ